MCWLGGLSCHPSVNCRVLADSIPPLVLWGFKCIQVGLPEHTLTLTFPGSCLWSWILVCLQPVSQHQGCFLLTDTLQWPLFFIPGTHNHLFFFLLYNKDAPKDYWFVEFIKMCSFWRSKCTAIQTFPWISHLTGETCLVCKVHWVCKSIIQICSGMGLQCTTLLLTSTYFHFTRQPLKREQNVSPFTSSCMFAAQ